MKKSFTTLFAMLTIISLLYGVLATLFIRITGWRIRKKMETNQGIALTFDDGPNPLYTIQLLDLLKRHQIKATFFVVGEKVAAHPEIVRRMHEEGHAIGIHHYQHVSNWRLSPNRLAAELAKTDQAIFAASGTRPTLYRPPWGRFNLFTLGIAKQYDIIMWSHIFGDWKITNCEAGLLDQLRQVPADGSIVLLHDDGANPGADELAPEHMLKKLSVYLEEASAKGIAFTTVDCEKTNEY